MDRQPFASYLNDIKKDIFRDIDKIPFEKLDSANVELLTQTYVNRNCQVAIPTVDWSKEVSSKERSESSDSRHYPGYPPFAEAQIIETYVVRAPFTGDLRILSMTARSTMGMPGAVRVMDGKLVITVDGDTTAQQARARYDQIKDGVQAFLQAIRDEYERFLGNMKIQIAEKLNQRRAMLQKDKEDLDAFGIPPAK